MYNNEGRNGRNERNGLDGKNGRNANWADRKEYRRDQVTPSTRNEPGKTGDRVRSNTSFNDRNTSDNRTASSPMEEKIARMPAFFPHVNMASGKVMDVVDEIHSQATDFSENGSANGKIVAESRLLEEICRNPSLNLGGYADKLMQNYDYSFSVDDIVIMLRNMYISRQGERSRLVVWASKVADCYAQAAAGNREYFDMLLYLRQKNVMDNGGHLLIQEKTAAVMIYVKYPELDKYGDKKVLYTLGKALGKNYLYVMCDALSHVYDFPTFSSRKPQKTNNAAKQMTSEQMKKKIMNLEASLSSANSMLSELQEEFTNQLDENKQIVLTDFFAQLNSDRYGNILDQLIMVKGGIEKLRKTGFQLPVEVNGLFIMVKQLIQFIRDNHINPIMKINQQIPVTAQEIEFCDYSGTPFTDEQQIKKVQVISPGWVFSDINVQISRPKLREIEENPSDKENFATPENQDNGLKYSK